jgi:hypothetical protein
MSVTVAATRFRVTPRPATIKAPVLWDYLGSRVHGGGTRPRSATRPFTSEAGSGLPEQQARPRFCPSQTLDRQDLGAICRGCTEPHVVYAPRELGASFFVNTAIRVLVDFRRDCPDKGAMRRGTIDVRVRPNEKISLFECKDNQGVSEVSRRQYLHEGYTKQTVLAIDRLTLLGQGGVPRYLKVDIEGQDAAFLGGLVAREYLSGFVSFKCYQTGSAATLNVLGYQRFRLIDRNPPGGFLLPTPQLEDSHSEKPDFNDASGPDLFGYGECIDYDAFRAAGILAVPLMSKTWFDCHAWQPSHLNRPAS